jgi:hypothetical protein
VQPESTMVLPNVSPPPITDRPADAEPRQVSMPAAARPGATTVGVVIRRFVEFAFAGLLILTVDIAPDELPEVCANTGVVIMSTAKNINRRMIGYSNHISHEYL